jgi:hypothetical protein
LSDIFGRLVPGFEKLSGFLRRHLAVHFIVYDHRWRQGAGADAGNRFQCVFTVGGRLPGFLYQLAFYTVQQTGAAAYMTGGAETYFDRMLSGFFEAELGIEAGNAVNVVFGYAQVTAYFRNGFVGNIPFLFLYLLEHGDQIFSVRTEMP